LYNKIILAGNLTRDIEIRYAQSGTAIGNTAIATSRKFKSQSGEQKEEVLFVDITFFGRTAEIANQYLRKGSKVLVDGRLKLDQWTAQDGSKRSKHSVTVESLQMLGSKDEAAPMGGNGYAQQGGNTYGTPPQNNQNQQAQNSYAAPQQNNYQQNQAPTQPAPSAPTPPASIPEIDIDEEEIPF
jgi:single-strand DNA-binding protein